MADSLLIIVRRGPYGTVNAAEALRHLNGSLAHGLPAQALMIDDGVYCAVANQKVDESEWVSLSKTMESTLALSQGRDQSLVLAHIPSLTARGLEVWDLVEGVRLIGEEEATRLLAEAGAVLIY
ncbi:MAG: DsrE family protein [Chloroflexi bacterium]|nr:DsrE family protein [Chloroflexota bacterium]